MGENKYRLLAIIAHPDDEILFAGLLLKLRKKGWFLSQVIFTNGGGGITKAAQRKKEAKKFARLVGINKIYWLGEKDGFLTANEKVIKKLVSIIRKVKPNLVILLNPSDYHKDHRESYLGGIQALEMATRNSHFKYGPPLEKTPLILISDGLNLLKSPDLIVDVSTEFKNKIEIIKKVYVSQMSLEILNFVKGLAMVRGARIKAKYGEGFTIGKIKSRPAISCQSAEILKEILN